MNSKVDTAINNPSRYPVAVDPWEGWEEDNSEALDLASPGDAYLSPGALPQLPVSPYFGFVGLPSFDMSTVTPQIASETAATAVEEVSWLGRLWPWVGRLNVYATIGSLAFFLKGDAASLAEESPPATPPSDVEALFHDACLRLEAMFLHEMLGMPLYWAYHVVGLSADGHLLEGARVAAAPLTPPLALGESVLQVETFAALVGEIDEPITAREIYRFRRALIFLQDIPNGPQAIAVAGLLARIVIQTREMCPPLALETYRALVQFWPRIAADVSQPTLERWFLAQSLNGQHAMAQSVTAIESSLATLQAEAWEVVRSAPSDDYEDELVDPAALHAALRTLLYFQTGDTVASLAPEDISNLLEIARYGARHPFQAEVRALIVAALGGKDAVRTHARVLDALQIVPVSPSWVMQVFKDALADPNSVESAVKMLQQWPRGYPQLGEMWIAVATLLQTPLSAAHVAQLLSLLGQFPSAMGRLSAAVVAKIWQGMMAVQHHADSELAGEVEILLDESASAACQEIGEVFNPSEASVLMLIQVALRRAQHAAQAAEILNALFQQNYRFSTPLILALIYTLDPRYPENSRVAAEEMLTQIWSSRPGTTPR